MSKTNLAVGERVSLIPFKHKGKVGVVKYIGEIAGKNSGNWLGIELDEPKGDGDGDCDGEQVFECRPGHGLFLRPTQVKSLLDSSVGKITEQPSAIMPLDESLMSGLDNMASLIGGTANMLDAKTIENNLNTDPTREVKVQDVDSVQQQRKRESSADDGAGTATTAEAGGGGAGRVRGWKDRLAKLREQKELEKKLAEEKANQPSQEKSQDQSFDQVKDIFAPAKGLERNEAGKIQIDKEKIEEKKEPVFEKKIENLVNTELEAQKRGVPPGQTGDGDAASPTKPRMTMMERQAAREAETKAKQAELRAKKEAAAAPLTATMSASGAKAPSRLARPTAAAGATDDRKQKLLEKQKLLAEKAEQKKASGASGASGSTTSRVPARGLATAAGASRVAVRSKLQAGVAKAADDARASRLSTGRKSISGLGAVASRLGASRASVGAESSTDDSAAGEGTGAQTSRVGTSRQPLDRGARGASANKDGVRGVGRNTSANRGDPTGLNKTRDLGSSVRGTSANKDGIRGVGTARSGSKERLGLSFGGSGGITSRQAAAPLDPSMTTIKKQELQDLKDQNEKQNKELYELNIKFRKVENEVEIQKRDHGDAIETLTAELTEQHSKAQQFLNQKHNEERNELIRESNKGNDSKLNELKAQYDTLQTQKMELAEELAQTIEELTAQREKEVEENTLIADAKYEELKEEHEKAVAVLKQNLEDQNGKLMQAVEKLQAQKAKVETLEETVQANKIDIEANQLELEMLKEEKQELLAEMMDNSKLEQEDILNTLSTDEIKQQNRKLRQAITSLAQGFEAEKEKLMTKIEDSEGKKAIIASYEKKLQDMDVLLEELDRKEEELAEMKIENEMCLEYETMVEEMAQEILRKEEELEEYEKKNKGLEDILGIQEGYGENLEQYNQELTEELADKDAEFSSLEQQKIDDEELLLDLEDENQKYREKVQQQTKTIKDLAEQLEAYTANSDEKSKIVQLVENQNNLVKQLQDNEKQNLSNQLEKIDYHWQNALKSKVIEGIIPKRLQDDVHFDSLDKLNVLNKSMYRALLMFRFICEKQLPNVENMYGGGGEEEIQKKIQFVTMMITLGEQAILFINSAQRILICVNNMSVEQYVKATTTLMAWKKFEEVSLEMGFIIEKLKDQNLSLVFDTSQLQAHIRQVLELHFKIEKLFVEKTPEEVAQEKPGDKDKEGDNSKYAMNALQLERQKLIQQCYKLDLRNQAMRMCIAVTALSVIYGGQIEGGNNINTKFIQKSRLIYGRLLDVVFKLDHVEAEENGKEYLNLADLRTDHRLSEKFEVIKVIWSSGADSEIIMTKDWNSLLDAIQRDISQLFNDYKFKRLISRIKSEYSEEDVGAISNIDQIFFIDRFKNDTSPWMEISKRIKTDIQNSEQLKDKIELLNTKNREALKQNMQQDRTINTLKVTTKSLEQRLAAAQTKIEELNQTKSQNEELTKDVTSKKKQLEKAAIEIKNMKQSSEGMQKKYEELEKKAKEGAAADENQASSHQDNLMGYRKNRGYNQQSRQSRTSTWFQELAKTSMLGGRKIDSSQTPQNLSAARGGNIKPINSVEVQKVLQAQEENFSNVIFQLQYDRMRLRGKEVSEKLNKMQKSDGALNRYIKNQSDKSYMNLKLSREDQSQLTRAVENVENLRTNVKLQMACVKVVDLRKKQEAFEQANENERRAKEEASTSAFKKQQLDDASAHQLEDNQFKADCVKTNMNINYMIIQAREQVNDALKKLMSKDSKLTTLHIDKMATQIREEQRLANASTEEDDSLSDDDLDSPGDAEAAAKKLALKKKHSEESRRVREQNTISIGQIQIKSGGGSAGEGEKVKTKNIVFNVKSLRALQSNMGVFSI